MQFWYLVISGELPGVHQEERASGKECENYRYRGYRRKDASAQGVSLQTILLKRNLFRVGVGGAIDLLAGGGVGTSRFDSLDGDARIRIVTEILAEDNLSIVAKYTILRVILSR